MLTPFHSLSAARKSTVRILGTSCLAAPLCAATSVTAQQTAPPGPIELSGNVAVVTDYRDRGISQSGGDFAVQGGIDAAHESGFFAGGWVSTIDGGDEGEVELDLYAGYGGRLSEAFSFDVGLGYNFHPLGETGANTDYFEPYAAISTTLGPAQARAGVTYAWEQDALGGDDNLYLYTDLGVGVPATPVTLNAHLGYTDGALAPPLLAGSPDGTGFDYSLGATAIVAGGLELGVSYVGVDGPSIDGFTDDTIVGSVGFSF